MEYMQSLWEYGIILALVGFFIIFLHYIRCFYHYHKASIPLNKSFLPEITILLPIKNEEVVIKDKLQEITSMNYPLEKMTLLIIDSKSKDNTIQYINEFFASSVIKLNYEISIVSSPGKSFAINHALDLIKTDFSLALYLYLF